MAQAKKQDVIRYRGPEPAGVGQRIALVYNPDSNVWLRYASQRDAESFLQQLLDPFGLDYELIPFSDISLDTLPERIRQTRSTAIWAAGGDGTALAMAPLAQQLELPLGILPTGTINMLARDLGISLNLATAVRQLLEASVSEIDMAEVNGRPFLCISNLGLATRFSQLREDMRHRSGWIRWPAIFWHMVRTLLSYPNLHIEIEAEGKTWKIKSRAISISNNPLCDQGGILPYRDRIDTGKLAIYITKETSIWSIPRLLSRLMMGNWQHDPELLVIHTPEALLRLPHHRSIRLMIDGEVSRLSTPLRYLIRAHSLKILKPEASP
ncbi:MAG: diacylglycerol kinase family protein [Candidatus Sericytochromatia bacterium]